MISLKNIKYNIEARKVLDDVSLDFCDGEISVITGANGAGKTTLLKIIMGIFQQKSGEIFFDGQEISSLNISQRAKRGIAYAFQAPVKFKGLTIKDLFEIADKNSIKLDGVCEHLSKVGLCARKYLDREFNSTLSGGELKRIELALALARNAKVNLFDEPEAGIDLWSFDALTKVFLDLKKQKKCIVIVSHEPKIMEIADKIIILGKDGKVEKLGRPSDVLSSLNNSTCIKLKGEN